MISQNKNQEPDKKIEETIKENLKKLVNAKIERQKKQESELEKYSSYVEKNKLCEGSEIIFLWKKIAEELYSGRSIKIIESDTKDRIFKHYEFLILESINNYGKNIYLTPLELVDKIKKSFWNIIAGFCYPITNKKSQISDKSDMDDSFIKAARFYVKDDINEIVHYERQKFLGYNGRSYFIYRNKGGSVDTIHIGIRDEHRLGSGVFRGTDEEKQRFADEYEKKWSVLAKFEKEFYKKNK